MTLMKDSLYDLASCYRKHMDCCELDKPGTGEFSSMGGTLFSFNHSSCLGGYCEILFQGTSILKCAGVNMSELYHTIN